MHVRRAPAPQPLHSVPDCQETRHVPKLSSRVAARTSPLCSSSSSLSEPPMGTRVFSGIRERFGKWLRRADGICAWMSERAGYVTSLGRKPRQGCPHNRHGFRLKTRVARVSWHNAAATQTRLHLTKGPAKSELVHARVAAARTQPLPEPCPVLLANQECPHFPRSLPRWLPRAAFRLRVVQTPQ
jgi:hypothetical protein